VRTDDPTAPFPRYACPDTHAPLEVVDRAISRGSERRIKMDAGLDWIHALFSVLMYQRMERDQLGGTRKPHTIASFSYLI